VNHADIAVHGRICLRLPHEDDRAEFRTRMRDSSELHDPWLEPGDPDTWFDRLLRRNDGTVDRSLFVRRSGDDAIVGVFNLSQIFYGPFRSAYLSYYAFAPFARMGYMREGLEAVLEHALVDLRLHRLEANIQPDNDASAALVRGAGFRLEGFSPRYLRIRGVWRDHDRWAITAEDRLGGGDAGERAS
jgi:[ribosomal protein S5]-alanine N-acetyltransferase